MFHVIWIGILLGIGLMLAPLVLRLAIWAMSFRNHGGDEAGATRPYR